MEKTSLPKAQDLLTPAETRARAQAIIEMLERQRAERMARGAKF